MEADGGGDATYHYSTEAVVVKEEATMAALAPSAPYAPMKSLIESTTHARNGGFEDTDEGQENEDGDSLARHSFP